MENIKKDILEFINKQKKEKILFLDIVKHFNNYDKAEVESTLNILYIEGAINIETKANDLYEIIIKG